MAWVKVPEEHHPIFLAALPDDRRIDTMRMFGGIAARINGHIFAGLFGRSVMLLLDDAGREEALALEGAGPFDPMGNGRRSDKVMLPESMMHEGEELAQWIRRAFEGAARLPPKATKPAARKSAKLASRKTVKAAPRKKAATTGARSGSRGQKRPTPKKTRGRR
jgi:hypothetical protein